LTASFARMRWAWTKLESKRSDTTESPRAASGDAGVRGCSAGRADDSGVFVTTGRFSSGHVSSPTRSLWLVDHPVREIGFVFIAARPQHSYTGGTAGEPTRARVRYARGPTSPVGAIRSVPDGAAARPPRLTRASTVCRRPRVGPLTRRRSRVVSCNVTPLLAPYRRQARRPPPHSMLSGT
jgi:hypothetical protein